MLVVDDVHLLASGRRASAFQILARQAMSNLHIVLTAAFQTDDALLSDLKGELARLGPALLAFSEEDIRAYCALCGLKVSPDQIRALHGATGGWVSGVYLHCRHYAQHGAFSLPAFARSFTLPSPQSSSLSSPQYSENELPPDMAALLEEQLYRPLSPDVRDMLFALCPLEQFTLPQADFCCGTDTRAALGRLSDRTRLSAAGKGAACTPSTPYSGACCCACSVHFHANSGRPSTAAAATGSRRRTNSFPRWSTITRRAISSGHFRSWNGTWPAIWSRKAPPSSPGSFRIARRRFCP
ncbi:MAG: helix-turn-helix transcriptional regulator, partial [Bilophila wadsworthia]